MKSIRMFALAASAAGVVGSASAQLAYGTDTMGNLYVVNVSTGGTTLVGNHGQFLESLAYDKVTGRLFGHDTNSNLVELSTANAAVINTWNTGLGNVEGMDMYEGSPDTLWMTDFNDPATLHGWSTASNSFFTSFNVNSSTGFVRTMCFEYNGVGDLALMMGDNPGFQTLWETQAFGTAVARGTNGGQGVYGMDYIGGRLYGLGSDGNVWSINPADGMLTKIADTGDHFWLGMSEIGPVPEPGTMIALGAAFAGLAARRRRK